MHSPLHSHIKAALRVLKYLKGSHGSRLQLNKKSDLKLRAYNDVDWAKCPKTRMSVIGFCVFLGDFLILGKARNNIHCLKAQLRLSTKVLLLQHVRLFGWEICFIVLG